jgi:hypothetical protein
MVESAEDRTDSDGAVMTLRPWSRRLEAEGAMGAIVVVVADELGQDRAQERRRSRRMEFCPPTGPTPP